MFHDSIKYLKQKTVINKKGLAYLSDMIDFRDNCGGEVIGYHGTSSFRAKSIANTGFKNTRCTEGGFGVYFWNREFKENARMFAIDKARHDNDDRIAIIKAHIWHPEPDWLEARPQWIVDARYVFIENIEYLEATEIIDY